MYSYIFLTMLKAGSSSFFHKSVDPSAEPGPWVSGHGSFIYHLDELRLVTLPVCETGMTGLLISKDKQHWTPTHVC